MGLAGGKIRLKGRPSRPLFHSDKKNWGAAAAGTRLAGLLPAILLLSASIMRV